MHGDVVDRLGELLRQVGFNGGPYDTLRMVARGTPPADALVALERPEETRLARLAALLVTAQPVPRTDAEAALHPLALDELAGAGLIEIDGSDVRARVSLVPFDGLIVAGDPLSERTRPEFVPHVAAATRILAYLAIRSPTGAVLDMGTGSGALALLAAGHSERVTGVDINPRALSHARLGARLNRVDNVDWLEGDWFEPVQEQLFDLMLVNPPYAISPDATFIHRESSVRGDELSRHLVRDSAQYLREGGVAIVACNWLHQGDEWDAPLHEWVAELGCDALLLHYDSMDPLGYVMAWHSDLDGSEHAEVVTRWAEYHNRIGVEKVGWGAIVLRRRTGGPHWTRTFHLRGGPNGPGGDQLARVLAGCSFLETHAAAAQFRVLLSTPWRLVEGHRLDQTLVYQDGGYASGQAVLQQPGLNLAAHVDMRVVGMLLACNGERPLSDVIAQTQPPEGLDRSDFHTLCLDTVRHLIATGYLVGEPLQGG